MVINILLYYSWSNQNNIYLGPHEILSDDEGLEPIMERMKKLSDVLPASEQERIQRYELVQSQLCDSDTSADNGLEPAVKPYVEDSGYSYLDCSRRQFAQQSSFILQVFVKLIKS